MKLSREEAANRFGNLVAVATSDGELADGERQTLMGFAFRLGVLPDEAEAAIQASLDGATEFDLPQDPVQGLDLLTQCVAVAALDGYLADEELELMTEMAHRLGLDPKVIDRILERIRVPEANA